MKKIISLLLCLLAVVPLLAFNISAADSTDIDHSKLTNISSEGSTYATSIWNNDSQHRFINDGVRNSDYQYWRPSQASAGSGIKQHCGMKFKQYYDIHSLTMYARLLDSNVKYTVEALVEGEWVTVTEFRNSNYDKTAKLDPKNGSPNSTDKDAGPTYQVKGLTYVCFNIQFSAPVNTKNIRIVCTEYTPAWEPPIIQEVEFYGHLGYTPTYDIPDGAILSKNACLGASLEASSTTYGQPAAFAADIDSEKKDGMASDISQKFWKSQKTTSGESITATFEREFNISHVSLNFGFLVDAAAQYTVDVELCIGGTWNTVASDVTIKTSTGKLASWVKELDGVVKASAMRVTFTNTGDKAAELNEMGATIADDEKAVFLNDYLTEDRMASIAGGNLAPYGSTYASSSFDFSSASEHSYINDGSIADTSFAWVAGTMAAGEYCGITFKQTYEVETIVLYFNNNDILKDGKGDHIMSFDIMAKFGDTFIKVGEGTSCDASASATSLRRYQVSIQLDKPIETDDIRIVFTSNGQTFPYLTELEIYAANDWIHPSYNGYVSSRKALAATKTFADKSVVARAALMDKYSPVQNIAALIENANMAQFI